MAKSRYVTLSYEGINQAMRLPGVTGALRDQAQTMAVNASTLARASGAPTAAFTVEETVRPATGKHRPEAQVRATPETEASREGRARLLSALKAAGRVV